MIIGDDRGHFLVDHAGGLGPGGGLPIIFAFFLRNPGRKRLVQIVGQRVDVRLIHFAELQEFAVGLFAVTKFHAVLGKNVADAAQILRSQAVVRQRLGSRTEDLRKIDDGVTRNRKSKLGLFFTSAFDPNNDDRASVQNCRERSNPGLVVVLRAKIGEHGIGEMALHQVGAPKLPLLEENAEGVLAVGVAVAAKKFAGSGRSAGAGIKKRDIHFALGERAIDEWQVADDGGKKTKSKAGFGDD